MLLILAIVSGLLLAYANGANDNFKGVATLLGSGIMSYRRALSWATLATGLGSLTALLLARKLLVAFTGQGLVASGVVADPVFPASVALAAGTTVLLATRLGLPISTTHALVGALTGAGLMASTGGVNGSRLMSGFMLPLLTSPFLAVAFAAALYPLRHLGRAAQWLRNSGANGGDEAVEIASEVEGARQTPAVTLPALAAGSTTIGRSGSRSTKEGTGARRLLDALHYSSAGAVSFARGLNDTPKIAALLLVGEMVTPGFAVFGVGVTLAAGGLISARRIAETMAWRVTEINRGQGFCANIVTAALVIGASGLGMPVSTTHVSCGSLFGIGAVTGQAHWRTMATIVLAWVTTLPIAALLGAVFFTALAAAA